MQEREIPQTYEYYAFISYKREDERFAKWLQKKLERYNVPSTIRNERPSVPKHIRPIFRDKTDLGAGGLTSSLRTELERSHYLIVICSPKSAQSEWVAKEIEVFRQLGREENVIPFIVGGIPHSGNNTECLNSIFTEFKDEPLGINILEIGRNKAIVKVLARLLDLRFDKLWNRHRRNQKVKRICYGFACTILALLSFIYWDYTRPLYEYYTDYVDKWGIPEGIVKLDKEEASNRRFMYRFEYRRIPIGQENKLSWRLSNVCYINSYGEILNHSDTEWLDRAAIIELLYGQKSGEASGINYCDRNGKVLMKSKISSRNGERASLIDLQGSTDSDASGYIGASSSSMTSQIFSSDNGKTSIKRYSIIRDINGFVIRKTFHSNNDDNLQQSMTSDAEGIFGMRYLLDSLGRILEVEYLGVDEQPCTTRKGIAGRSYEYDKYGVFSKVQYFGLSKEPVLNDLLWSQCVKKFDNHGNVIEERLFDTNGNLCMNSENYAMDKYVFDDRGNITQRSFFSPDEELCVTSYGFSGFSSKFDKHGNETERSYFGTDKKPCMICSGFSKWASKYDSRGNCIESSYYSTDGSKIMIQYGYSTCRYKYDINGNETEQAYFDVEGQRCISIDGYSKQISRYDERGNLKEKEFYDIDEHPCLTSHGFSKFTRKYDIRDNITEECCFGIDGKPCIGTNGYHKVVIEYDDFGNNSKESYFGDDDKPILLDFGYSTISSKYDNKGNEIERQYFGVNGKPCLIKRGFSGWKAKYDVRGNNIEKSYFDTDGNLIMSTFGYARICLEYNDKNEILKKTYYDVKGKPVAL